MPPERRVLDATLDNQCIFTQRYDRCNLHAIQLAVDDKASGACRQVFRRVHKARASGRLRVRSRAAAAALEFGQGVAHRRQSELHEQQHGVAATAAGPATVAGFSRLPDRGQLELLLPFAGDKVAPAKGDFIDPSILAFG